MTTNDQLKGEASPVEAGSLLAKGKRDRLSLGLNARRIGRIVMAYGRDAADAALTTTFGTHTLKKFNVVIEKVA